jgi:hypothetical protein
MVARQRKNISANKEQRKILFLSTLIQIPILNTDIRIQIRPGVLFEIIER